MKKLIILFLSFILSFSSNVFAQSNIKTDSFKVEGNCNMCKKRIEDAAFVKGVKHVSWNKDSHQLVVIYKADKTNLETIAQSVAKAGHRSDMVKTTKKDYESLPKCCHYETEACEH